MSENQGDRARPHSDARCGSATAGIAHHHSSPLVLGALDGRILGRGRNIDMGTASALIAAAAEACLPCRRSLTRTVLAGDRMVVAGLAAVRQLSLT